MRIIAYRKESSVEAIADGVYADMTPAMRAKAVAALVRANPGLTLLNRVKPGTVLMVPKVPGLRVAPRRAPDDPAEAVAETLDERLKAYHEILTQRNRDFQQELKTQASRLKSRRIRRILNASPVASDLAKQADKEIPTLVKKAAETGKRLDAAMEKLRSSLTRRFD